ncbi:Hypothetical predicted protein, partial [Paramuricea clavata]
IGKVVTTECLFCSETVQVSTYRNHKTDFTKLMCPGQTQERGETNSPIMTEESVPGDGMCK